MDYPSINKDKYRDKEADQFAVALLIPRVLSIKEIGEGKIVDVSNVDSVTKLANKFQVTNNLMIIRLVQLELVSFWI